MDSDSLDWKGLPASEITQQVTSKVQPGSIVLSPEALPGNIKKLLQDGAHLPIILPQPYTTDHTIRQLPG